MINEAKEELEKTFRHNYAIRGEECVRMDAMREEEHVHMAHNTIIILYVFFYLDASLETSSDEKYGSGRR